MDYHKIRRDLLLALREPLSQAQLNRKLGFQFNQVYRWESGITKISWPDFLRLAKARKINMTKVLREAFHYRQAPERADLLIRHIIGTSRIADVARLNHVTPFRVRRWLRGTMAPDLEDMLSLIDQHAHVLVVFIGLLTDVARIGPLRKKFAQRNKEIQLLRQFPVSGALLRVLELSQYQSLPQHIPGWIAQFLGLALEDEEKILAGLERAQLIQKKNAKYVTLSRTFDPQGDAQAVIALRVYWLKRTAHYLEELRSSPTRHNPVGQMVFSCSGDAWAKIVDKYVEFFGEIRTLIDSDEKPADQVRVLGIQLLDVSSLHKQGSTENP